MRGAIRLPYPSELETVGINTLSSSPSYSRPVLQVLGQLSQLHCIEPGLTSGRNSNQALLALIRQKLSPLMHRLSSHVQRPCHLSFAHAFFQKLRTLQPTLFHQLIITSFAHPSVKQI